MPLTSSALSSGLSSLAPAPSEATAIDAIVLAWRTYFGASAVGGVAAVPGSFETGISAMRGALAGMSAPNAAASKIQNGVQAFWDAISALAPTIWPQVPPAVLSGPAVAPPTISAIASALSAEFTALTTEMATLAQAAARIAAVIHTNGGVGGTAPVTIPPGSPVITPIL